MCIRDSVTAVTVVAGAVGARAVAQQPAPRPATAVGSLTGTVTNTTTGSPLRAEVSIDRPRRSVRADSAGRFAFRDIPAGRVRLLSLYTSPSPRDRQKSRMPSSA